MLDGYRDGPSEDAMCSVFTPLFHFSLAICYTAAQPVAEAWLREEGQLTPMKSHCKKILHVFSIK